ncbi:hypothetical protein MIND_01290500 [Mycena indigotica]|uniref:Uncharacterized protein n=1 Tax=Mycena indigotica TaxID=2126181 RepID=A0A8H6VQP4_9AGAR|nr:uncharacterized protein MIND_01290500 [Mycena indigotica]KAF7290507.1 hypothetical protein MIND_01290500 [Mycena indigotica]
MTNAIYESFATYLRTIQKRWRESKKEASIQLHNKVKNRRQVRKYQLFHQRRYLAYVFAPLRKHADMLEQFGVDGMSSDESEVDEEGVISFQSHMPAWRAEIVTIWLHLFDVLHSMLRKTSLGPTRRSAPRQRKHLRKVSQTAGSVPGLPINAYDSQWQQANSQTWAQFLQPTAPYDFFS